MVNTITRKLERASGAGNGDTYKGRGNGGLYVGKRKVEYWNIKMLEQRGAGDSSENRGEGEG